MTKILLVLPILLMTLSQLCSPSTEVVSDPEKKYSQFCAGCHGAEVEMFVDRNWKYGNTKAEIITSISKGRLDDGMPAFAPSFSKEEIEALAEYILVALQDRSTYEFEDREYAGKTVETDHETVRVERVVEGLEVPWGLAFLPDGDLLIAQREGTLIRADLKGNKSEISGLPEVRNSGQGGLMDMELHPSFKENQLLFLSFSKPMKKGGKTVSTTAIMKARLEGNALVDKEVIFEALPYSSKTHHYGSRMRFGPDGFLYFTVGDRGNRDENPQSLDNHCGKVHRIGIDGSIPEDNPFVNTPGAKGSIWSFGHRNPQGMIWDLDREELWTNEHGPRGGDEINLTEKGKNYGWPVISYGINYNGTTFTDITKKEGMEQPVDYWVPSIGVCGLTQVTGDRYPGWKGDLISGSLRFDYLHRHKIKNGKVLEEEKLFPDIGRVRVVEMGRDGLIYVGVEEPGTVYRIVPVK